MTTPVPSAPAQAVPADRPDPRGITLLVRIGAVLVAALVVGGLTSPLQQYLPDALRSFANSAGGWTIMLVLAVWLVSLSPVAAAAVGAPAFVLMLLGYGVVSAWRGAPDHSVLGFWGAMAIIAGPPIALAASWLRSPRRLFVALGVAIIAIPLIGEAAYGLTVLATTTSPVWWSLEAGVAGALVVATAWSRRRPSVV